MRFHLVLSPFLFLGLLPIAILGSQYKFNYDWCSNIEDQTSIEVVISRCSSNKTIKGKGYLILNDVSERMLHNFFDRVEHVEMGLRLFRDENLKVLHLGSLKTVGPGRGFGGLWIENTHLLEVKAPNLENITGGAYVRGNALLKKESLELIASKVPEDEPLSMQEFGECNIDETNLDFTNCTKLNNLVLPDGYSVPEDFRPTNIYGCVYLRGVYSEHDFLENLDLGDANNFKCLIDSEQYIENNPGLCYKDLEWDFIDFGRRMTVSGNGSPDCKFQCSSSDFVHSKQRWCEKLDSDLIITDELLYNVNIDDLVVNLKRINGIIVIQNVTNATHDSTGEPLEEMIFPELEFVLGGKDYRDVLLLVDNTTLKRLYFPKLVSLRGGEVAIDITKQNPDLKIDFLDLAKLEIAANGRKILIPESYKIKEEDSDEGDDSKEGEEEKPAAAKKEINIELVVGCSVGGAAVLLVLIAVVLVIVLAKKKSKSKKGKSYNKLDGKEEKTTTTTTKSAKTESGTHVGSAKGAKPSQYKKLPSTQQENLEGKDSQGKEKSSSTTVMSKIVSKLKTIRKSKSEDKKVSTPTPQKRVATRKQTQKNPDAPTKTIAPFSKGNSAATKNAGASANKKKSSTSKPSPKVSNKPNTKKNLKK